MRNLKIALAGAVLFGSVTTLGLVTGETSTSASTISTPTPVALSTSVNHNEQFTKKSVAKNDDVTKKAVSSSLYSDVDKSYWAYPVILWGTEKEIVKGYPDGTFKPKKSVTESEFLAMLIRAYNPSDFEQLNKNYHWADNYYLHSIKMNYPTLGARDSKKRGYIIDREHVAEIIAGTQGVNYKGEDAIQYLLGTGLAQGKKSSVVSINNYDGEGELSRAEAVQFIKNVLENGVKDKDGNPIMKPRPEKPSDPNDLPSLPNNGDKDKDTPTKPVPSGELGKVSAKQLFEKTKEDAKKLGYSITGLEHTSGRFTDKENQLAAVSYLDRPEDGSISITIRNLKDANNVELYKRTLENYGVDSNAVITEFNNINVNTNKTKDGKQYESQGATFIIDKTLVDGREQGVLVIIYSEGKL